MQVRLLKAQHSIESMTKPYLTEMLPCNSAGLATAAALLAQGETVAVPTETVYGLAANASSTQAISRIYAAKERPTYNPLIVHVGRALRNIAALEDRQFVLASAMTNDSRRIADRLMSEFWPGPLTLVMPRGKNLPDAVAGGLPTVGFRMPSHDKFLDLLDLSGLPLAAPSANRSCRISPTTAEHVRQELDGRIPLILDGGPARIGVESTIVAIGERGELQLLRPGGLPIEALEAIAGSKLLRASDGERPLAPGMTREHYAPTRPLILASQSTSADISRQLNMLGQPTRVGVIHLFSSDNAMTALHLPAAITPTVTISLNDIGDGRAAAASLFGALRAMDEADVGAIIAEFPEGRAYGLWPAVADRLTRAAAKWSAKMLGVRP